MKEIIIDNAGKEHILHDPFDPARSRVSYGNTKTRIPSINLLAGDRLTVPFGSIWAPLRERFPRITGTCHCNCASCKHCTAGNLKEAAEIVEKQKADCTARGIAWRPIWTDNEADEIRTIAAMRNSTPDCYAAKITRNPEPAIKYILNTVEAKTNPRKFWALVEQELFNPRAVVEYKLIRIHDSGDFFNYEYFTACMDFVKRHSNTRFGAYTKAYGELDQYGIDNLPENLTLSCSPWEPFCPAYEDLPQFVYDDGTNPALANLPHCPAVDKNGHATGVHCDQCQHCYRARRGDRWAVYAH